MSTSRSLFQFVVASVLAACASTVTPSGDGGTTPSDVTTDVTTDVWMPHPTPCTPSGQPCGSDLWCCGGYCDRGDGGAGSCQPVPAGTFPCGTTYCRAGEYCELTYSDVTSPDTSVCRAIPAACGGTLSCSCVPQGCGRACSLRDAETVVLRCPGG